MPFNIGDTVAFITEGNQKFTVSDYVIKPQFDGAFDRVIRDGAVHAITVEEYNVSIVTYTANTTLCNMGPTTAGVIYFCVDARALKLVKRFDINDMNLGNGGNNG